MESDLNAKVATAPAKRGGRSLGWLVFLLLVGATAGSYFLWFRDKPAAVSAANTASDKPATGAPMVAAPTVTVMAARQIDMPVYLRGLGSVTASSTVTVRAQV